MDNATDWSDIFNSLVSDIYFGHNEFLESLNDYKCPKCNRAYADLVASNEDLVVTHDGREPLCESCYKEKQEYFKKRRDCYFYHEYQDMNATILSCSYSSKFEYGCPCTSKCPNYISDDKVRDLVLDYLKRGDEE